MSQYSVLLLYNVEIRQEIVRRQIHSFILNLEPQMRNEIRVYVCDMLLLCHTVVHGGLADNHHNNEIGATAQTLRFVHC